MDIRLREPSQIVCGDSLCWTRYFSEFPASAGWTLTYSLRGGAQPIEFTASPGTDGVSFQINVAPSVTATWLPGPDYVMQGQLINAGLAQQHTIFYSEIALYASLATLPGDVPVKTFAETMVSNLEQLLLGKSVHDLQLTEIERTRISRLTIQQIRAEHGYWYQLARNQADALRAKNRQPNRNRIRSVARIVPSAYGYNRFGISNGFPYFVE